MNAIDIARALRRSWWLVLALAALCGVLASALYHRADPTYESHLQLFVAARGAKKPDLTATYQGGQFTQQRVQSYVDIARSPRVTGPVIARLGLDETPEHLADRITAAAPLNTVLINITVKDDTALGAQRTAREVGRQFIRVVDRLEQPRGKADSPVKLSVSVPPNRPSASEAPDKSIAVAAGVVLGLLLGILAALVRARVDVRIRTVEQLSKRSNAHLLGVVPYDRAARATPVTGLRAASADRSEAVRRLRTSLSFVDPADPPHTLVVTSSLPREGKTTVALGLAMALAEAGKDVVLIEGDLRDPCLVERLGVRAGPGLCGVLVEGLAADKALETWHDRLERSRMRVMVAGGVAPNPSEILGSDRMRELLADLRTRSDIIIIDAPALLPVTDAAVLAAEADGVLLVARLGRLRPADLGEAFEALAAVRARLLGLVANAAPRPRRRLGVRRRPPEPGPTSGPPMAETLSGTP